MATAQQSRIPTDIPSERIAAICKRWGISRLELFGSRARGDHREESDYDFLYTKSDPETWGIDELLGLADDLEALLGHKVDLVYRKSIEESRNPYRKRNILRDAIDVCRA